MDRLAYLQAVVDSQKSPIEVFMGMQEDGDQYQLIDVRIGEPAFLKEKIVGAKEIPLHELAGRVSELDHTKIILVVTWSAACTLAKQASILLLNQGFQVLEIAGGNEAWKATGLPVEPIS